MDAAPGLQDVLLMLVIIAVVLALLLVVDLARRFIERGMLES